MVEVSMLNIGEEMIAHRIIRIVADGACLFRGISYLVYGTQEQALAKEIRLLIVDFVVDNWSRYQTLTHDPDGDNYHCPETYKLSMSKSRTYGSYCELKAAAEIFQYVFEVYIDGKMYLKCGVEGNPVGRLRFSGLLSNGHFDVYSEFFGDLPLSTGESLPKPEKPSKRRHEDEEHEEYDKEPKQRKKFRKARFTLKDESGTESTLDRIYRHK